ncbi:MAG: SpoIIE family protein phosphatase [Chromatiaceae bacterium]|nr:SpoIIE family protein phosphatase [Chromatiaceae bacterium]
MNFNINRSWLVFSGLSGMFLWLWFGCGVVSSQEEDEPRQGNAVHQVPAKSRIYHVLLLNSYNQGYSWTDNEVRAVEEAFGEDVNVILKIEYMDTKMINSEEHFRLLKDLFANKYRDVHFDVIIATDDDALRFLRHYRNTLFPGTPVVFAGINDFEPQKIAGFERVTGVNERADFRSNLELVLRLRPETRHVYVIVDGLTAGRLIRKEFELAAERFRDRLQFHYLTDLTMAQVLERVNTLGQDAVVFYLSFFRDADGMGFTPWEAIPLISINSAVPLFGQVDYMLGKGIVGGRLKNSYYQGQVAVQMARRILSGERVEDIPIVMESPNYYMFDYEQLERFDIAASILPADSIIINEPQTFYYKYKTLIWTVLTVIALLVGFILVLLFNISKRKRAQKGLQDIIGAMSSVLDQESIGKMREMLTGIIHRVIFLNKRIDRAAFFNYSGYWRHFDPTKLAPLSPSEENPDDALLRLVRRSIENGGCSVLKHECVALFHSKSIPANVLYLKGQRRFDEMDQNLLEILTNNVSMAMESLEKNKIQESLETARKIQQNMLTKDFDRVAIPFGVDLHAQLIAAKEVGGDFYDCFATDEDHLCVLVGDVSGKGVPAALFMAMAKTLIRSDAERHRHPHEILHKVNNELVRDNEQCMFVTLFLAIYDRSSGEFSYANGGHNPPCRIKANGRFSWLPADKGVALGILEDVAYQSRTIALDPGDALFIYTDGITEAMSTASELFGEERLEKLLAGNIRLGAKELTDRVVETVGEFAKGAEQSDDITVLFIRNGAA